MLEELRRRVCEANLMLVQNGLVKLTWGNVSGIDRAQGLIVIKPSGVPYEALTPEKMVVVDLEGKVVEGELSPSTDTPTHLALYEAFQSIGGVVHTHSTSATIWAQAGLDITAYGTTHADYFYGDIPCTALMKREQIEADYEWQTGYHITDTFAVRKIDYNTMPACLVASHGPFTWGDTPEKAVENSIVLEEVAHMALYNVGFQFGLPRIQNELLDKHFLRKHGEGAYYGQASAAPDEDEIREDLNPPPQPDFKIEPSENTIELQNISQIGEVDREAAIAQKNEGPLDFTF